jgi:transcriptional regulator with GAF, ATPase, and Fis domain
MSDITTAISTTNPRKIHIHRAAIQCMSGPEAGESWLMEQDIIRIGSAKTSDIVITDPTVSRYHAEIRRGRDGVILRDLDSTNGTFVGHVRAKQVYLGVDTRFRVGRTEFIFTPADEIIDVEPSALDHFENLVGESVAMREVFGILERIAPTDLTVLITGETGTGKELASRALHSRSSRAKSSFVVFDCGAAAENLIESDLFGHQKGAFTGAIDARPGVFEMANGGTIFLDEIGDLPIGLQPKLLRVLEQREVRRVGSSKTKPIDVRVVAATNRNLREEVDAGRFREDLYYRLAVVELVMPPLRDRIDDLHHLAHHLLERSSHNTSIQHISAEVIQALSTHRWPGNVRELNNMLERTMPFTDGNTITMETLPASIKAATEAPRVTNTQPILALSDSSSLEDSPMPFKDAKDQLVEAFEHQYLVDLLDRHDGNVSKAARAAGMDRKSISRLMKKHGITRNN